MSNSALVDITMLSPNCNHPRNRQIRKITIHHMAGILSVSRCGEIFSETYRQGSSNYGIDSEGRVGLYVDEGDRAWTSSNSDNDNQAVTIEVSNCEYGGQWAVSEKAYAKLIDLCTDICVRNGIHRLEYTGDASGNLTMHKFFTATMCPGPYLEAHFPDIAQQVNERLQNGENESGRIDNEKEAKPNMTQEEKKMYTQCTFVELLGRLADENGLENYCTQIPDDASWDDDLSSYVDDNIRESDEYTQYQRRQYIDKCYHLLLGREPDENGINTYMQYARFRDIFKSIYESEEAQRYRNAAT